MTDVLAPASQEHAPLVKHETDVGAFFFIENEVDEIMNNCQICGTFDILEDGMCWWCIADANDPDPYVDDSLNEVSMGRFDDDPPEW